LLISVLAGWWYAWFGLKGKYVPPFVIIDSPRCVFLSLFFPFYPFPFQPMPTLPLAPIIENPFGVHDHDVLCGRGAFVNGHTGNGRLRDLALARKRQFDAGNYAEKRSMAQEVVQYIRSLDPPGRFLRRVQNTAPKATKDVDDNWILPPRGLDGTWEELNDEKAIHKACQVSRRLRYMNEVCVSIVLWQGH
jgi:hypothetical protein